MPDDPMHKSGQCPTCNGGGTVRRGEWDAFDRVQALEKLAAHREKSPAPQDRGQAQSIRQQADLIRGGFTLGDNGEPNCPQTSDCPTCGGTGKQLMQPTNADLREEIIRLRRRLDALESKQDNLPPGIR